MTAHPLANTTLYKSIEEVIRNADSVWLDEAGSIACFSNVSDAIDYILDLAHSAYEYESVCIQVKPLTRGACASARIVWRDKEDLCRDWGALLEIK